MGNLNNALMFDYYSGCGSNVSSECCHSDLIEGAYVNHYRYSDETYSHSWTVCRYCHVSLVHHIWSLGELAYDRWDPLLVPGANPEADIGVECFVIQLSRVYL